MTFSVRGQELCERGGRGVPNSPCGLGGRKATFDHEPFQIRLLSGFAYF